MWRKIILSTKTFSNLLMQTIFVTWRLLVTEWLQKNLLPTQFVMKNVI